MSPFSRSPIEEFARDVQRELERVVGWENARRRVEVLEDTAEIFGYQWDKASAYANIIIAVGFAGLLTAWNGVGPGEHPRWHAAAGLLTLISIVIFVLWEVFRMTAFGLFMQMAVPSLEAEQRDVRKAIERIQRARNRLNLWIAQLWLHVLLSILVPGLAAATIVASLFVARIL